jgi:hypothetical protein
MMQGVFYQHAPAHETLMYIRALTQARLTPQRRTLRTYLPIQQVQRVGEGTGVSIKQSSMAKLFDAVNRFRLIEEATSQKDDVPPMYLLDQVASLAREDAESAASVADHVQRNLEHKNPVVKWKVGALGCARAALGVVGRTLAHKIVTDCTPTSQALKIIKHLLQKGCSQFQRSMQRHSSAVRCAGRDQACRAPSKIQHQPCLRLLRIAFQQMNDLAVFSAESRPEGRVPTGNSHVGSVCRRAHVLFSSSCLS